MLISCENLSVSYEKHIAVENVSFHIDDGDYLCIVGENGSGKSTLMKAMLGLLPLKSGKISFNGITLKDIGYLPQQTQIQRDFPASVFEVVLSGCLSRRGIMPFFTKSDKLFACEKLERLGISELRYHSYRELSGGQQQRVLLARALCATERLIFLDEPVSGLDPIVTAEMYDIIRTLNQKDGITVVMVSHDVPGIISNASKILHMDTRLLFFGSSSEYMLTPLGKKMLGGASHD